MDIIEANAIRVIDVDTHVVEDYELWTSRVSVAKYGDRVPHVKKDANGAERWYSGDRDLGFAAGVAPAGQNRYPPDMPPTLDDIDIRAYLPERRVEIMDEHGIHAQVLYPNVAGFGAGQFQTFGDMELALLLVRAYNDWLADYAAVAPGRYIPIMALPFWDIDLSIKEIDRAAKLGHRGITFSSEPEYFGCPKLSDPCWDPLWTHAQDRELSINFHIGSGGLDAMSLLHESCGTHTNFASFPVTFFLSNARAIATLIGGGICHRFPRLNFVSVESGVGWVPFALQALDWMWKECGVHREHPEYRLLPSEYFRRQIHACFWFESGQSLETAIDLIGADRILYETDFPHPTSMSPGPLSSAVSPRKFINDRLGHLPVETLRKILHDNAAKLYHLDS